MPVWLDWTVQQKMAASAGSCGPAELGEDRNDAAEAAQSSEVVKGDAAPAADPPVQEMDENVEMDVDWGDEAQPATPGRKSGTRPQKRSEEQLEEPDPAEEKQKNMLREREAQINLAEKFGGQGALFDKVQCDAKLVDTTDPTDTAALPAPADPNPHWQADWLAKQQRERARQGDAQAAGTPARRDPDPCAPPVTQVSPGGSIEVGRGKYINKGDETAIWKCTSCETECPRHELMILGDYAHLDWQGSLCLRC